MQHDLIHHDELIIRMLANDDEQAINILFDQYYELLFDIASQSIKDPMDADDLIQNLMINLWIKRHTLKLHKPLKHYLVRSAANRARNYKRDKARAREIPTNKFLETRIYEVPADSDLSVEDVKKVWRLAKDRMSSTTRIILLLSRKHSMSYREIAAHLNISNKTVEKHITAALKILRQTFKNHLKSILF